MQGFLSIIGAAMFVLEHHIVIGVVRVRKVLHVLKREVKIIINSDKRL